MTFRAVLVESDFIFLLNIRPEHDILLFSVRTGFAARFDVAWERPGTWNRRVRRSYSCARMCADIAVYKFPKVKDGR